MNQLPHILIVDDEQLNQDIITELLNDVNKYRISTANDGEIALKILLNNPEDFDVILLDRMMPKMDGMELLKKIKEHSILRHCTVIFQTAKIESKDISDGFKAGAHYYLTKPFDEEILLSIVRTAVEDRQRYNQLLLNLDQSRGVINLLQSAVFEFKDLSQASKLASHLSWAFPEPEKVAMGLSELLINAVEHGNLEISYQQKTLLNQQGLWLKEVEKRLITDEYKNRKVIVTFKSNQNVISINITDEGKGFNWKNYLHFDISRATDSHGRGIAMANNMIFPELEYHGNGNSVTAKIILN